MDFLCSYGGALFTVYLHRGEIPTSNGGEKGVVPAERYLGSIGAIFPNAAPSSAVCAQRSMELCFFLRLYGAMVFRSEEQITLLLFVGA